VRRAFRWWLGRRPLGKIVDGEFVEAPQRLERTWAWLMARRAPVTPPRRITVLVLWVLLAVMLALDFTAPGLMLAAAQVAWFTAWGVLLLLAARIAGYGLASLHGHRRRPKPPARR